MERSAGLLGRPPSVPSAGSAASARFSPNAVGCLSPPRRRVARPLGAPSRPPCLAPAARWPAGVGHTMAVVASARKLQPPRPPEAQAAQPRGGGMPWTPGPGDRREEIPPLPGVLEPHSKPRFGRTKTCQATVLNQKKFLLSRPLRAWPRVPFSKKSSHRGPLKEVLGINGRPSEHDLLDCRKH